MKERLNSFKKELTENSKYMFGYPLHTNPSFPVKDFLDFTINNLGDPFKETNYKINSFEFEREIVDYFARLYDMPSYWGYVTSCGSEGNLKGLSLGLDRFPDAIIYYSNKSHYSIKNAIKLMRADSIEIETNTNHSLSIENFKDTIDRIRPAIVNINMGTTMVGAIDNRKNVLDFLNDNGIMHHIHVDGALAGGFVPFLENKPEDFDYCFDTISISGHKFFGCPIPCGVLLSNNIPCQENIEYIGGSNSTVFGSRSGLAVLAFWKNINTLPWRGIAKYSLEFTNYALDQIKRVYPTAWKNDYSTTVVFPKPSERIVKKWQLAVEGDIAHIIIMPDCTIDKIDTFVKDLKNDVLSTNT
jgi:histidine decarboxylase